MSVSDPENLHRLFAERASAGDLDGLMSLYEDGACFIGPDGVSATGATAIRKRLESLLALAPRITSVGNDAVLAGDIALISNRWRIAFGDDSEEGGAGFDGTSSEVARRQADGSWRYVIDRPSLAGAAP